MAKIMIMYRKYGKDIRLDLSDLRTLCKKCRKTTIVLDKNTTKNFDF